MTAQQYGHIASQTAVNALVGGNPLLKPETADTVTAGFVLTPLSNVLFSADYWRIKANKFISNVPAQLALPSCLNTGNPFNCALIQRDANGSLSTGLGASAGRIVSTRYNTGSYGNSGIDFEGRYNLSLRSIAPKAGSLEFSFSGSIALDNPINVTPGTSPVDCTDLYGPTCSTVGPTTPVPRWRHRLRTTWESPAGVEVSLNWRYIGRLNSEFTSSNPNLSNPSNIFPVDSHIAAYRLPGSGNGHRRNGTRPHQPRHQQSDGQEASGHRLGEQSAARERQHGGGRIRRAGQISVRRGDRQVLKGRATVGHHG